MPVIVFFDSHARGKDPLKMYAALADAQPFILVGSNVSRNGQRPEQSLQIYDELMRDVKTKFAVDLQRIAACGFSGGARVAAMLAQNRPEVKHVIACSAGFQPRQGDTFGYYAIIGTHDFNYMELWQLQKELDDGKQPHAFAEWSGGHEWPVSEEMEAAMDFVTMREMDKDDPRLDSLLKARKQRLSTVYGQSKSAWLKRKHLLKAYMTAVDGLTDVTVEKALHDSVGASRAVGKETADLNLAFEWEMLMRDAYVPQLTTKSVEDWRKIADNLRKEVSPNSSQSIGYDRNLRLLNFLSLNTYFQVDGAIKSGNLQSAEHFLQIYAIVDPENAEHAYLTGVVRMRQGRPKEAIQALQKARELKFKDAARLEADPEFASIRSEADFVQLLDEIRKAE
jgi:pimeloyl-ACP methyl ester carboxylesterase